MTDQPTPDDDLPPAPPRPKQRRFQGTIAQISGALGFYRICAYVTGVMLLLLVAKMIMTYAVGVELYAGGTAEDGSANALGFHGIGSVVGGQAVSYWVAVVHGWIYVVYLVSGFRLWFLMRWPFGRLATIVLGGVVPFLSFIVERRIAGEARREMEQNPEAARRY